MFTIVIVVVFFVILIVPFIMVFFMTTQHRTVGNFVILHLSVLVAVSDIQSADVAAQGQVHSLTIVHRLRLGADRAA